MTALEIKSLKILMSQLLTGNTFDIFLLEKAIITTSVTFSIDGYLHKDFYKADDIENTQNLYDFKPWSELKELCFGLIKGKNTPLNFKFALLLKPEHMQNLYQKKLPAADISQLKALTLLIRFDNNLAQITTGISCHSFMPDKEPEKIWDAAITKYLSEKGISFEEI